MVKIGEVFHPDPELKTLYFSIPVSRNSCILFALGHTFDYLFSTYIRG